LPFSPRLNWGGALLRRFGLILIGYASLGPDPPGDLLDTSAKNKKDKP
jgi:hypothetical protein